MEESSQIHQPCPDCGSSDALAIYETNTYCFSCKQWKPLDDGRTDMKTNLKTKSVPHSREELGATYRKPNFTAIEDRHIELETCRKYGVQTSTNRKDQDIHIYPYYSKDREHIVNKVRVVEEKKFYSEGESGGDTTLFGQQLFKEGGKFITICEGEIDATKCWEVNGLLLVLGMVLLLHRLK